MSIMSRIKNLVQPKKVVPDFDTIQSKVVFQFDRNKLFKGHHGHIGVSRNHIGFSTHLFNYYCNQTINLKTQKLAIKHEYHVQYAKWVAEKMIYIESKTKKRHISCVKDNTTFFFDYYPRLIVVEVKDDIRQMCGHFDMITRKREMSQHVRFLLNKIKAFSDEEFYTKVMEYNESINNNDEMYLKLPSNFI